MYDADEYQEHYESIIQKSMIRIDCDAYYGSLVIYQTTDKKYYIDTRSQFCGKTFRRISRWTYHAIKNDSYLKFKEEN